MNSMQGIVTNGISGLVGGIYEKIYTVEYKKVKNYPKNYTYLGRVYKLAPRNLSSWIAFQIFIKEDSSFIRKSVFYEDKFVISNKQKNSAAMTAGFMTTLLTNPIECFERLPRRWEYYNNIYPRLDGIKRVKILYPKFIQRASRNALLALGFLELPNQILEELEEGSHKSDYKVRSILLASCISGVFTAIICQPFNYVIDHHIDSETLKVLRYDLSTRISETKLVVPPHSHRVKNLSNLSIKWNKIHKGVFRKMLLYSVAIYVFQIMNTKPLQEGVDGLCNKFRKLSL